MEKAVNMDIGLQFEILGLPQFLNIGFMQRILI
jgi:hypothetical protein